LLAGARRAGLTTSLDLAWRDGVDHRAWMDPCLSHLDFVFPNLDEARAASGRKEIGPAASWFRPAA